MRQALAKIISGTLLANVIVAGSTPLLTRLYQPEQFADLALLMSWGALASIVLGLRLDLAIFDNDNRLTPQRVVRYQRLLMRAYWLLLPIVALLLISPLDWWVALILPYGALLAINNFMLALAVREKQAGRNGKARTLRAAVMVLAQALLSMLTHVGLLLGEVLARLITAVWLKRGLRHYQSRFNTKRIRKIAKLAGRDLSNYFKSVLPQSLLNSANVQLLFLMAGLLINPVLTGTLAVIYRVAMVPASIIAQAITHTTLDQVADSLAKREGARVKQKISRLILVLATISTIAFGLGYVILAQYGTAIFGQQWQDLASVYLLILPFCCVHFVASPFVALLTVLDKKQWLLGWDLVRLLVTVSAMLVAAQWSDAAVVLSFSISMCVFYSAAMYAVMKAPALGKGKPIRYAKTKTDGTGQQ